MSAPGLSILFTATTNGRLVFWIILIDSSVCGFTPSSAATTKNAKIGRLRPARTHGQKSFVPGVSIKVIFLPLCSAWYADVLGDAARFAFGHFGFADRVQKRGFPWSTCPITTATGGRGMVVPTFISVGEILISSGFGSVLGRTFTPKIHRHGLKLNQNQFVRLKSQVRRFSSRPT